MLELPLYGYLHKHDARLTQGILTYRKYSQRVFKLKFSTLLKANDVKYTENSKKLVSNKHNSKTRAFGCNIP